MSVIKVNSTKGMTAKTKYSYTKSLTAKAIKAKKLQPFAVSENSAVLANIELLARELAEELGMTELDAVFEMVTMYLGDSHGRHETIKLASVVDSIKLKADSKVVTLPFTVNGIASYGVKMHQSNISTAIVTNADWKLDLAWEVLESVLLIQSDVYENKLYNGKISRGLRSKPYYDHITADSALGKFVRVSKWDNSKAAREVPNHNTFYIEEYLQPFKNIVRSSKCNWSVIEGIARLSDADRKRNGIGSFTMHCSESKHSFKLVANIIAKYLKATGTDGFDKLKDTQAVEPIAHCGQRMELFETNKVEDILSHFLAIQTVKAEKLAKTMKSRLQAEDKALLARHNLLESIHGTEGSTEGIYQ